MTQMVRFVYLYIERVKIKMPDVFHWCSFIFLWFCYSQTAECPVCGMAFPAHLIEAHAAESGDASSSNER